MPWRLIVFIVVFAVLLVFISFNLGNKCDISFGPEPLTLKDVPVFLTIFTSFILGFLSTLPLVITAGRKRKSIGGDKGESIMEKKRREFRDKHKKPGKDDSKDSAFSDGGSNGID